MTDIISHTSLNTEQTNKAETVMQQETTLKFNEADYFNRTSVL